MSAITVFHSGSFDAPGSGKPGRHYVRAAVPGPGRESRMNAPLRLTRRGRLVLIGLPLLVVAALLLSLAGVVLSPAKASSSELDLEVTPTVSVIVPQGSSLWGIAAAVAPERDPRDVVAEIVQLNNLNGGSVVPGQHLFVPAGRQ